MVLVHVKYEEFSLLDVEAFRDVLRNLERMFKYYPSARKLTERERTLVLREISLVIEVSHKKREMFCGLERMENKASMCYSWTCPFCGFWSTQEDPCDLLRAIVEHLISCPGRRA